MLLSVLWLLAARAAPADGPDEAARPSAERFDEAIIDEAWPLVRVEVPDFPGALLSSAGASLLAAPPTDGTPWRAEILAEPDLSPATPSELAAWSTGSFRPGEAFDALGAGPYRAAGYDGSGVKVAVFDIQWQDWELHAAELGPVQTHDCARHSSCARPIDGVRPGFSFEYGSHGVACAEVIRDLAPGVELHLVQVSGGVSLENAVSWAIREQIDVVSMSLSFFGESFGDGTGPVNAQARRLRNNGVLLVTSAGNSATEHTRARFTDADGDSIHDGPDGGERIAVELSPGTRRFNLHWDDFGRCETDLDAYVYAPSGALVGRGLATQDPEDEACVPVERIAVYGQEEGIYDLVIHRKRGPADVDLELFARGGLVVDGDPRGSIVDPGSSPTTLTVGAVNASGYLANPVEYFSSWGPTAGGLNKPDLVGPDGLTGSVYGNLGFFGTSASTPAVAAAIALLLDARPELSPVEAAALLRGHALSTAPVGAPHDPARGAGAARLPPLDAQPLGCRAGRLFGIAALLPILIPLRRRRAPR